MSDIVTRMDDLGAVVRHELRARGLSESVSLERLATLVMASLLGEHPLRSGPVPQPPHTPGPDTMPQVLEFIEEHLSEALALEKIAAVTGFSPFHFARVFRAATGMSPHQYIIGRRVERAKLLLLTTNWTVAAIAREVGFASGSHLAVHLKRAAGVSPTHYRTWGAIRESA